MTSVHAMCVPYLLVCLLPHQAELLSPPGQHLPPMGRGLLYDSPSRRTPPNKQQIHPAQTRVVRDHTTDGDIEKNLGPVDAQAKEDDIPPHHREMVTRPASEIETASNPHPPTPRPLWQNRCGSARTLTARKYPVRSLPSNTDTGT